MLFFPRTFFFSPLLDHFALMPRSNSTNNKKPCNRYYSNDLRAYRNDSGKPCAKALHVLRRMSWQQVFWVSATTQPQLLSNKSNSSDCATFIVAQLKTKFTCILLYSFFRSTIYICVQFCCLLFLLLLLLQLLSFQLLLVGFALISFLSWTRLLFICNSYILATTTITIGALQQKEQDLTTKQLFALHCWQ